MEEKTSYKIPHGRCFVELANRSVDPATAFRAIDAKFEWLLHRVFGVQVPLTTNLLFQTLMITPPTVQFRAQYEFDNAVNTDTFVLPWDEEEEDVPNVVPKTSIKTLFREQLKDPNTGLLRLPNVVRGRVASSGGNRTEVLTTEGVPMLREVLKELGHDKEAQRWAESIFLGTPGPFARFAEEDTAGTCWSCTLCGTEVSCEPDMGDDQGGRPWISSHVMWECTGAKAAGRDWGDAKPGEILRDDTDGVLGKCERLFRPFGRQVCRRRLHTKSPMEDDSVPAIL